MSRDLDNRAFLFPPLFQVAKVEYVKRKPKLKEVFVRLEDHLECMCTSQHHVVEHSEAETGKCHPNLLILAYRIFALKQNHAGV